MRIKQLYSYFRKDYREEFLKKYNMIPYSDKNQPVVFFGCYARLQVEELLGVNSTAIVIWAGWDSLWVRNHEIFAKRLKEKNNIRHIAISNFIEDDLKYMGIPYSSVPIVPFHNQDILPHPLGDSIYIYDALCTQNDYSRKLLEQVKRKLPEYNLIETIYRKQEGTKHFYNRAELLSIYKNCFIGLRFSEHDGLPNTACELGLMGRKILWNGKAPNAINYSDADSIIEHIKKEYSDRKMSNYLLVAQKTKEFLNIGDDFLHI